MSHLGLCYSKHTGGGCLQARRLCGSGRQFGLLERRRGQVTAGELRQISHKRGNHSRGRVVTEVKWSMFNGDKKTQIRCQCYICLTLDLTVHGTLEEVEFPPRAEVMGWEVNMTVTNKTKAELLHCAEDEKTA